MRVFLGQGVEELFDELPDRSRVRAEKMFDLICVFPRMFSVRPRGVFKGYRYFIVDQHLFYYSVSSAEIRFPKRTSLRLN